MKKIKIIDWYIIALLLGGISAVALRSYALLNDFNRITLHFENSPAATIGGLITVFGVLLFMSYSVLAKKECGLIARTDNAATYIPAGIVSVALLFMGIERFQKISALSQQGRLVKYLAVLTAILAILSVASFFVSIFLDKKHNIFKAAFSLSIVFFLAFYAALLFFTKDGHPTNSPNRIVDQMTYLFSATFFLFETRIHLGRAKWRLYVSFGLAATLLCFFSSIPSIITYIIDGYTVSTSIIESVLSLTLALFIASRVFQTKNLTPDAECSAAKSISALATFREEQMNEERKLSRAQENNNVEIEHTQDASNYTFDIPYVDPSVDYDPEGADIEISKDKED